jgi:hypothetical protein
MDKPEKRPTPRTVELGKSNPVEETESAAPEVARLGSRHSAHVALQMHDGSMLIGSLSVGASRLSDFMNNDKEFVVLVDDKDKAHILNKKYIVKVTER